MGRWVHGQISGRMLFNVTGRPHSIPSMLPVCQPLPRRLLLSWLLSHSYQQCPHTLLHTLLQPGPPSFFQQSPYSTWVPICQGRQGPPVPMQTSFTPILARPSPGQLPLQSPSPTTSNLNLLLLYIHPHSPQPLVFTETKEEVLKPEEASAVPKPHDITRQQAVFDFNTIYFSYYFLYTYSTGPFTFHG